MTYTISTKGLELIKKFEGCKLKAYKAVSTEKYYTIGYGHYGSDVKAGMTITQTQADAYLKSDVAKFEKSVNAYNLSWMNQNRFDALVSFTYNCGATNLKTLLNAGKRTAAEVSAKITAYNKSGGKVLAGLTKRRKAEKELFDTVVPTSATATATAKTTTSTTEYVVGKSYTLASNMFVRASAGGAKKAYDALTTDGKKHSTKQPDGTAVMKKGTVVTCKALSTVSGAIWMQTPSGWMCAKSASGGYYIK